MKNKKIKNPLKENYLLSWNYIKQSRNFIYIIIITFILFILIGFFISPPEILEQRIIKMLEELLNKTIGMSWSDLIKYIFLNNLQSSFLGLFLGIAFGLFSLGIGIVNGYVLGFVMFRSIQAEGVLVLWRLVPHGIFELPALFISLGLGFKLWTFIFEKNKLKSLKNYFFESVRVFIFVIIPLLLIAAIIEASLIFFS